MSHNQPQPRVVYAGKHLEMVLAGHWEYARRVRDVSAVGIIALTPQRELLLVEQYRVPIQANAIELPAGLVGDEQQFHGEQLEAAARRELLEETGYQANRWEYLYDGPSSAGMTDEQVHLFLATDLTKVGPGGGEASEDITVHAIPVEHLDTFFADQRKQGKQIDFKARLATLLLKLRTRS